MRRVMADAVVNVNTSNFPVRIVVAIAVGSILVTLAFAGSAAAQSTPIEPESDGRQTVRSTLTSRTLADLPLGENVFSALETTQPELIADRFNSSGLNAGEGSRVGGFLGSWSQTLFRIGEIDISDPTGSGAPLLFPELLFWQQVDIEKGLMPADLNAPGLVVTLAPRRPGTTWTTTALTTLSGGGLAAPAPGWPVPPVARLQDWQHASALVSGPLKAGQLGIVAGGTWTGASKFVRESGPAVDSSVGSGFVHLVYTPSEGTESRTVGWVQHARVPFAYRALFPADVSTRDTSTHVQSTWERRRPGRLAWRVLGGVTARYRRNDAPAASSVTAERLTDGPIPSIASATGDSTAARWTIDARGASADGRATWRRPTEFGLSVTRASARTSDLFTGPIGELVDGVSARVWTFSSPGVDSRRHSTTVAAFARDHWSPSPALGLDAALRFESVTGSADGAATGVGWWSWLPSATLRWEFAEKRHVALLAGYRRSANQLNLDVLAFGDPTAQTAVITRWLAPPLAPPTVSAAIIDRVGPGTGGNPSFSRVDPGLKRPTTDEFVVGLESVRRGWLRLGLTGIARRETGLIGVVDVGTPIGSYSTIGIPDPGHDFVSSADDQILVAYNRLPSTFGQNQYVLTNPGQPAATAYALMLTAQGSTGPLFLLVGATASAGTGSAANRNFQAIENDQDAAGELFTDPNAETFARGRLFSDRAFTIKWTTVYRMPGDFRIGAIARYQDGQPFARLVVASGLNQGSELIRAYPNGGNRFTFTGTLDIRVQKGFAVGPTRLDAIADFYNLATRSNEVDEYVVTGPAFRTPTSIEPPRAIHLGLRLTF